MLTLTEALVASFNFHRFYKEPDLTMSIILQISTENILTDSLQQPLGVAHRQCNSHHYSLDHFILIIRKSVAQIDILCQQDYLQRIHYKIKKDISLLLTIMKIFQVEAVYSESFGNYFTLGQATLLSKMSYISE